MGRRRDEGLGGEGHPSSIGGRKPNRIKVQPTKPGGKPTPTKSGQRSGTLLPGEADGRPTCPVCKGNVLGIGIFSNLDGSQVARCQRCGRHYPTRLSSRVDERVKITIPLPGDRIRGFLDQPNEIVRRIPGIFLAGPGEAHISGWMHRQEQVQYAEFIARWLSQSDLRVLFAHAGVGIGKTLGYLVPSLMYRQIRPGPIVVSTQTIALMDQLVDKDLDVAKAMTGSNVAVLKAKGEPQFLCYHRLRLNRNESDPYRRSIEPLWTIRPLELHDIDRRSLQERAGPIPSDVWTEMRIEHCLKQQCQYYDECPYPEYAKQRSIWDGIVVTTHGLLARDLVLRQQRSGGMWPDPWLVIVDEADGFEDALRDAQGGRISPTRCSEVANLVEQFSHYLEGIRISEARRIFQDLAKQLRRSIDLSYDSAPSEATRVPLLRKPGLEQVLSRAQDLAQNILADLTFHGAEDRRIDRFEVALADIGSVAKHYLRSLESSESLVWVDRNALAAGPTRVGAPIASLGGTHFLLSSGTLAPDKDFTLTKFGYEPLGSMTFHASSPFPYESRMVYALGRKEDGLLRPTGVFVDASQREPLYAPWIRAMVELIEASGGRALVLFTAKVDLKRVNTLLREKLPNLTILFEEEGGVGDVVDQFRTNERSVLLSTSGWQGIDISGRSLSLVVITKLPYPTRDDPLVDAKTKLLEAKVKLGETALFERMMLHRLAQGVGRLIRREDDQGAVVMLDIRANERWANLIEPVLPRAKVVTLKEGAAYLETILSN